MKVMISVLVENEPGVLSRIVGLFSQRNYNIETLTVAPTEEDNVSRITITTYGKASIIEQISKQLYKLIDVIKVSELSSGSHVQRELMLVKVKAAGNVRDELKRMTDIFRGQIVDVTNTTYTIQLVGVHEKLDSFIEAIDSKLIIEVVRSGSIGLARGHKSLSLSN